MMRWTDVELVSTMFHELAHQKLYVKGDSAFNESFATAVAEIGLSRWLAARGESAPLANDSAQKDLRRSMMGLVGPARKELAALYAKDIDEQSMREKKAIILNELSASAQLLLDAQPVPINNWLAAPLNNARLVSLNLYEGRLNAFSAIADECQQQMECFYARAEALAKLTSEERGARLNALGD
jgi:predicted aminopeptidase